MEKNTLLAVVLSVIVITVGFMVQNTLYPPEPIPQAPVAQESAPAPAQEPATAPATGTVAPADQRLAGNAIVPVPDSTIPTNTVVYSNGVLRATFDPAGARLISLQLLEHVDGSEPVEMIRRGDTGRGALELHFGDFDTPAVDALFRQVPTDNPNEIRFSRSFFVNGAEDQPFDVIRTFRFEQGEFIIEHTIELVNSVNQALPLNFAGTAYTISFGPQIGPSYAELDGRNEFRTFHYFDGNRRRNVRMRTEDRNTLEERVNWAALTGKYFSVIAVPGAVDYLWTFSNETPRGIEDGAAFSLSRPVIRGASTRDVVRFYVGPKVTRTLNRYDRAADNAFGLRNLELAQIEERRALFGWLENILKWAMEQIFIFVPNYGITIIILTILVKILLHPLTKKSFESTSKMQVLNPKIQELREKYKDDPTKMNQAMGELYKKEGVNPLGGCLPMLLQFPFFIAMFGVFNNHFDLRGAIFIPGWINDLSAPESIWNFGDFVLPLLGWNDLRLLPILFVGSQILSSMLMQNPAAGGSNSQMKMMQYGMPIMFFFILYNMPSGLLVYWIFSNLLTVGTQFFATQKRKHESS